MDAIKYLTGFDLQSVAIETEDAEIPGFQLRLKWVDVARPDEQRLCEPLVIDTESLTTLLDRLILEVCNAGARCIDAQWSSARSHTEIGT
ncbi:MAG: hypothetical protein ABIS28_21450 [Caldimonas sp.]